MNIIKTSQVDTQRFSIFRLRMITIGAILGLTGFLILPNTGLAQTVGRVLKKRSVVVIKDAPEGVSKGTKVCILNSSGKKVACGKVVRTQGSRLFIKIPKRKRLRYIEVGMGTDLGSLETGMLAESSRETSETGKSLRLFMSYSPALVPATYNKLLYNAPEDANNISTLWAIQEPNNQSLLAFNFQVGLPIGSFAILSGARYRFYRDFIGDNYYDLDPARSNIGALTETKATALGFWVDLEYLSMAFTESLALSLSSGLDFDYSTVNFSARREDDNGIEPTVNLAEAKSTLVVSSLRLGSQLEYIISKPFGMFFGATVVVPVASFGASFSGTTTDERKSLYANPDADLKDSLGHKQASFGGAIHLGAMLAF